MRRRRIRARATCQRTGRDWFSDHFSSKPNMFIARSCIWINMHPMFPQYFYPLQITFAAAFGSNYVSIALQYVRLFPETTLRKASIWMGTIGGLHATITMGILIGQCTPVAYFWDKSIPGGRCIKQQLTYKTTSSHLVILVGILFLLPIPTILSLHMSPTKRWGLVLTFSLGALYVPNQFDGSKSADLSQRPDHMHFPRRVA